MPGILNGWFLAPFHFDWRERASPLNDKVHFRAIFRPQMKQLAIAKILQPLPQFDPHPLLEERALPEKAPGSARCRVRSSGSAKSTLSVSGGSNTRSGVDFPVCRAPKTKWT